MVFLEVLEVFDGDFAGSGVSKAGNFVVHGVVGYDGEFLFEVKFESGLFILVRDELPEDHAHLLHALICFLQHILAIQIGLSIIAFSFYSFYVVNLLYYLEVNGVGRLTEVLRGRH